MTDDLERLFHLMIGGNKKATAEILERAKTGTNPALLVAAALLTDEPDELLGRAAANAATTRDRQLVAVAVAHRNQDEDLLDALVRDHLSDHPDNVLAAWIAAKHTCPGHCNH